jgi:HlyD family secretion protein
MKRIRSKIGPVAVGLLVLGFLIYAFAPRAVPVEVAFAVRAPIEVAVLEDGRTRIKERYVIAAPLTGRLLRVTLKPGDLVEVNGPPVAILLPVVPDPLDARTEAQAQARLAVAQAVHEQAGPLLERARVSHELAVRELARVRALYESRTLPLESLDRMEHNERMAAQEWKAAQFALAIAAYEVEVAQAALRFNQPGADPNTTAEHFEIQSPIDGRVLRVIQESATVVGPGTPLMEVGDPADLEVEIDVLSPDAVRIQAGTKVWLEHWGGERPIEGRVRRVEPAGFTKISALGVEEQRVWVIAVLIDPPAAWRELGDAFRVEARILIQEVESTLTIPAGALFRRDQEWHVFRLVEGRAWLQRVTVGLRNELEAEIVDGLAEGDEVVVHPSDRVGDGVRVRAR